MSNKIVPMIYRTVIDEVISNIKHEFDDYGVSEDILSDLQSRWENKVIASHVAEFEHPTPPQLPPSAQYVPPLTHPTIPMVQAYPQYMAASQVKAEPVEGRFPPLTANVPSYLPTLPGPTLPASRQPAPQHHYGAPNGATRIAYPQTMPPPGSSQTTSQPRIPQVDGPSSSGSESPSPPPTTQYAPRASHPSLPQPSASSPSRPTDSEEINSDLDDSDTEAEEEDQEGPLGETDIVFCTYDKSFKVARVKNKWKCVLKDGMIHVNGKDYLFAKCTCEFEW